MPGGSQAAGTDGCFRFKNRFHPRLLTPGLPPGGQRVQGLWALVQEPMASVQVPWAPSCPLPWCFPAGAGASSLHVSHTALALHQDLCLFYLDLESASQVSSVELK